MTANIRISRMKLRCGLPCQNKPKILDPFHETDLDFLDCTESQKPRAVLLENREYTAATLECKKRFIHTRLKLHYLFSYMTGVDLSYTTYSVIRQEFSWPNLSKVCK